MRLSESKGRPGISMVYSRKAELVAKDRIFRLQNTRRPDCGRAPRWNETETTVGGSEVSTTSYFSVHRFAELMFPPTRVLPAIHFVAGRGLKSALLGRGKRLCLHHWS